MKFTSLKIRFFSSALLVGLSLSLNAQTTSSGHVATSSTTAPAAPQSSASNPPPTAAAVPPSPIPAPPTAPLSGGTNSISTPPTPPPTQVSLTSDFTGSEGKEMLEANDKVIERVANMYEMFGGFVTLIITVVTIVLTACAGVFGYLARKSFIEMLADVRAKLDQHVQKAADSAAAAEKKCLEIEAHHERLEKALADVDALIQLNAVLKQQQYSQTSGQGAPVSPAAPDAPIPPAPASDELDPATDTKVSDILKGFTSNKPPEGGAS